MTAENVFGILINFGPLAFGVVIAAVNAEGINTQTELLESWARRKQRATAASDGWLASYVFNPLLWAIVKFSDWTDGFKHRGLKNGVRVTAAGYAIELWLVLVYTAVMFVIALVVVAALLWFVFGVMSKTSSEDERSPRAEPNELYAGRRGTTTYVKTGIFSEEEVGRTDEEGRVFAKTGMFSEEEIGRVASDGTTYRKTGMFSEEEIGRRDKDGRVYEKTGLFSEDEVGRVDRNGTTYRKTGLFSEEETGRHGKDG